MFNKNDPLIGAVQQVMQKNQAERDAIKTVNEKFGVVDRRALPHEQQREWDAAYNQIISEGIAVEPRPTPATQPETKVTGGEGIQAYDKSARSIGSNSPRPQGDNPKVSMNEDDDQLDEIANTSKGKESLKKYIKNAKADRKLAIDDRDHYKKNLTDPDRAWTKGAVNNYGLAVDRNSRAMKRKKGIDAAEKILAKEEKKVNPYAVAMSQVKKKTGDEPPMEKKNIVAAHKLAKKIQKHLEEARKPIEGDKIQGVSSVGDVRKRAAGQKGRGRMNMKGRYLNKLSEEEFEGGKTDTGKDADAITTKSKTDSKTDKALSDKINTIKENKKK